MKRTGLARRTRLQRKTRIKPRNHARWAKNRAEAFGRQAKLCESLPCCVPGCNKRGEPHHDPTVATGGKDEDTIPLCCDHHRLGADAVHRVGREAFQARTGVCVETEKQRMRALVAEE